ncbi:MAG: molybdopterin-synthase adenylyltransferase MoeB [Wenzhouxiangellaceae bacterium]|nr:molybdopterin-synthase adenylyltransferase MoeB [Wenzhouxiangellaceae bacterium]
MAPESDTRSGNGPIARLTPEEARRRLAAGEIMIDVRNPGEIALGMPEGAHPLLPEALESRVGDLAGPEEPVILVCATGPRALRAADRLQRLGYRRLSVVSGGVDRWRHEGLPCVRSERFDVEDAERYARQMNLPELGIEGQARLASSRVLLVGAGGLGSPAALYLAAAGIGTLGLVDNDRVERSNLHRQVVHREDRVGQPKTDSARATLEALNPGVKVQTHRLRLNAENVEDVFSDYEIIVDGSDNFPTRYLVNDACIRLGLPNVYGAVQRFEGQVSVFSAAGRPCYRCLFSEPPEPGAAPSCDEAGVLGVVPGIIGMLQALEVIKLVTGIGQPLIGRLLLFDARTTRLRELALGPNPGCRHCGDERAVPADVDQGALQRRAPAGETRG